MVIIMNDDDPVAFFITWTIYGTWLQGDLRGWRQRCMGSQSPQPRLAQWHRDRLNYVVILLEDDHQAVVNSECEQHCLHRGWQLWAAEARTNHVHVVVTAPESSGKKVRDQLKANCTRGLRERWDVFRERPVWSVGGDWQCINSEADLQQVVAYVRDAQNRMERGK